MTTEYRLEIPPDVYMQFMQEAWKANMGIRRYIREQFGSELATVLELDQNESKRYIICPDETTAVEFKLRWL